MKKSIKSCLSFNILDSLYSIPRWWRLIYLSPTNRQQLTVKNIPLKIAFLFTVTPIIYFILVISPFKVQVFPLSLCVGLGAVVQTNQSRRTTDRELPPTQQVAPPTIAHFECGGPVTGVCVVCCGSAGCLMLGILVSGDSFYKLVYPFILCVKRLAKTWITMMLRTIMLWRVWK